ncbi:Nitrite facilitator 1 [Serratia rubidaea]|uniref:Nitrite facilitator 1 n=1 Tax=Serratia rubidaea TaxID=61652 RepID=A0A4U9HII4_SERRU|nr:Nitrite facilitator 1 [Serratia rubidaea]
MLFSAVAVNLNKVGFNFTTDQLFMLTALPSVSGAIMRVPYSFVIPIFGGRRWTAISTCLLIAPCLWLGVVVQDPATPFHIFVIIALLCGFGGANFASSMANISFFFPKAKQGGALGLNGGLGNLGVSVMQLVAPLAITLGMFGLFGGSGHLQPDGSQLWLENAAWIWVPFLLVATLAAWFGMNDLAASKASLRQQLPVLKRGHLWLLSLLYLSTFGSFIGFFRRVRHAVEDPVSGCGDPALCLLRPVPWRAGASGRRRAVRSLRRCPRDADQLRADGAVCRTAVPDAAKRRLIRFLYRLLRRLYAAVPDGGLGSGSTFQMIAVIFRKITVDRVKAAGGSDAEAQREAVTDTAAALGFISAIGAIGGFFIPKAFGTSLAMTGSPAGAMKVFLVFYILCVAVTWLVYGRKARG